jgi:hypothetical protein
MLGGVEALMMRALCMIQLLLNILPSRILLGLVFLLQHVPQGSKEKSSLYKINSKIAV